MTTLPPAEALTEHGIAALKGGDKPGAIEFLGQSLLLDDHNEKAWLWLSGATENDAERKFCLERVLAISPQNSAAQRGLSMLPAEIVSRSPLLPFQKVPTIPLAPSPTIRLSPPTVRKKRGNIDAVVVAFLALFVGVAYIFYNLYTQKPPTASVSSSAATSVPATAVPEPTAEAKATSIPATAVPKPVVSVPIVPIDGLGISRQAMQRAFESLDIVFEPPKSVQGQEQVEGHWGGINPSDVTIIIIGPADNITTVQGLAVIPSDATTAEVADRIARAGSVILAAPDWADGSIWFREGIAKLVEEVKTKGGAPTITQLVDSRRTASMQLLTVDGIGMLMVSVEYTAASATPTQKPAAVKSVPVSRDGVESAFKALGFTFKWITAPDGEVLRGESGDGLAYISLTGEPESLQSATLVMHNSGDSGIDGRQTIYQQALLGAFPAWNDATWVTKAMNEILKSSPLPSAGGYEETRGAWKVSLMVIANTISLSIERPSQ